MCHNKLISSSISSSGQLSKHIVVGCVRNAAYRGVHKEKMFIYYILSTLPYKLTVGQIQCLLWNRTLQIVNTDTDLTWLS